MELEIKGSIINYSTNKKGGKITISIDDEQARAFEPSLARYRNKPIKIGLSLDIPEIQRLQELISAEQRKKIYALIKDIAEFAGDSVDSQKEEMKRQFCATTWTDNFSLSDCSAELANQFIEWLVDFCFMNGIELKEHPKQYFDDLERYQYLCIKNRICCVCGRPAEIHHWDQIGMRKRKQIDDSDLKKMALCREHHSEAHTIGKHTFCQKYHVVAVLFEG
jgi:hypothetical protein